MGTARRLRPLSRRAREICETKPPHWEYKLTLEMAETELAQPTQNWRNLQKGLLLQKIKNVSDSAFPRWFNTKQDEHRAIMSALPKLFAEELVNSWKSPANAASIIQACNLIIDCASRIIEWERDVKFTNVSSRYTSLKTALGGPLGHQLNELELVWQGICHGLSVFENHGRGPIHVDHQLTFRAPDGWHDRLKVELAKVGG